MQQNKATKKLSVIGKFGLDSNILLQTISQVSKQFSSSYLSRILNASKLRGYGGYSIFQVLICFQFVDLKNISQLMQSDFANYCSACKDVFYEFMKNPNVNWRNILTTIVMSFIKIVSQKGRDSDLASSQCFILDDTVISKSGKTIEKIGKVHNHTTNRFELGQKVLVLGFWDGKVMVPVDFSIHNEPGKNGKAGMKAKELKAQFSKIRDEKSAGYKRYAEVSLSKIEVGLNMIKRAIKKIKNIPYLLVDSWFVNQELIESCQKMGLHVVGLMKTYRKIEINGKTFMANRIGELDFKKKKHCKSFKCDYIKHQITYQGIEMVAFWVKPKGQTTWKLLISTNTKLKFKETMELYQTRWTIEVFFKECKQNLGLQNCQSTDLDAHIAHITICLINYTILALKIRFEDYETMGEVFREFKSQIKENLLLIQLINLLIEFFDSFLADLDVDFEIFISKIINDQSKLRDLINQNLNFLMPNFQKVA